MRQQDKARSSPKADKKINGRGTPTHQVTGVPGYDKGSGTPGWIAGVAKAAENRRDFNRSEHRVSDRWNSGAPEKGKAPKSPREGSQNK